MTQPSAPLRRRLVVVAGLIYESAGERLLVTRRRRDEGPPEIRGLWEFPGGKLEPAEEPRAALLREIAEELGVEVEVGPIVETLHALSRTHDIVLLCYRCRLRAGEPRALEVEEFRWVELAELDGLEFVEADRPFVGRLAAAARAGARPLDFDHSF